MAWSKRSRTLVKTDRVKGISGIRDLSDLKEPVKLEIEVKSDADADVVLTQLYKYSPLQTSFSMNFMALVDGKPRELIDQGFLDRVFATPDYRDPATYPVLARPSPQAKAYRRRFADGAWRTSTKSSRPSVAQRLKPKLNRA